MKDLKERNRWDAQANVDRRDPEKMLASLLLQNVPVTRIQMRTLCWDNEEQMKQHLRTNPLLRETFINLFRGDLEKRVDNSSVVRDCN